MDGEVALVTGASRGIGLATARALAARGAKVIAVSRFISPVGEKDGKSEFDLGFDRVTADVGDWTSIEPALTGVLERVDRVDVLVNCAGVRGSRGPISDFDPEDFRQTLAINTLGPFHLIKLVLPGMVERASGVIINISSGAGHRPRPHRSMYGTSKAALDHMSQAVAVEVKDLGVRVHVFHPGPVDTALFNTSRNDPSNSQEERDAMEARIRSGELQSPEEPAAALAWLASSDGTAFKEVIVPWNDRERRASIRVLAGLPTNTAQ
jgi:3-oxoacyl-[acyl-carrier protein] reductase